MIESTVTVGVMVSWVVTIGVGVVVIGLVKYIFTKELKRMDKVEVAIMSLPPTETLLTKDVHSVICKDATGDVKEMLRESRDIAIRQYTDLKQYLEVKIRAEILEELRKNNRSRE